MQPGHQQSSSVPVFHMDHLSHMQCVADIHDQPANSLEAHPKRENLCNIILKCTCVYLQYPREVEQLYSCNQNLLDLVLEAFQLVARLAIRWSVERAGILGTVVYGLA